MKPLSFFHSVRYRLLFVMLMATVSALLVTGLSFLLYERESYRDQQYLDIRSQAELIGRASIPALQFDDPTAAATNLGMLGIRPSVLGARLYTKTGQPFSTYATSPTRVLPDKPPPVGIVEAPGELQVSQTITAGGEPVGSIVLVTRYDLGSRIATYLVILATVFALSLIVALFVSLWLQRTLSAPILAMSKVAEGIMTHGDFSLRAQKSTDDEIGILVDAFNAMLDEIERGSSALEESERTFRQLANSVPLLCWMANNSGEIFWFNDRWFEYTGGALADMEGWSWTDVLAPDTAGRVREQWREAVLSGHPFERVWSIRSQSGAYGEFLTRAAPLRDTANQITLWFGTCTDITEQRRLAEQREVLLEGERRAREAAEQAGRVKDEFLATLSHELRTPLNAILGWTYVMKQAHGGLAAGLARGLDTIERNARVQARLIEDLLDMSRIVSGKVALDLQLVDPAEVARAAVADLVPVADAKGIVIASHIVAADARVMADPKRLQQIIWNLLSNSVKFTPEGGRVEVTLKVIGRGVELGVIDTGIGIAPEVLPVIFERFRQADASTTRQFGGLGLGLSIVKHLVELHGGAVRASSPGVGQGTTMTVWLPLREEIFGRVLAATPSNAPPVDLTGIRVLVIDDQEDARILLQRIFEDRGARIRTASSAEEGLSQLATTSFDVVVSDIGMPVMDGYEFLRRARMEPLLSTVPAIAVTAFARPEDRERALRDGYVGYVAKPIDVTEVLATVARAVGRTPSGRAAPGGPERRDL